MRTIITAIVVLLLIASPASAFSRATTLDVVGQIEIHSASQNETSKAGVLIQGEGALFYAADGKIGTGTMDQAYKIETVTAAKAVRPLRAITALQAGNGEGAYYNYALLTQPAKGETGLLNVRYITDFAAFGELDLNAEVFVSQGIFRSHIHIYNPTTGIGLREAIHISGQAYYADQISISAPAE